MGRMLLGIALFVGITAEGLARGVAAMQGAAVAPAAAADPSTLSDLQRASNDLQRALTGTWVGTLEYRDYSEPATSTKRVKLPTWLTVEAAGSDLRFHYIYDDGPTKTVTETSVVRLSASPARYESVDATGKVDESYTIDGLSQLKQGRGVLVLTGKGTENNAPVDVRTTLRVGRNILEMTRETGVPLTFRHAYTFVRAAAPAVTP